MAPRKKVETPKVAISPEPEAADGAKSSAPVENVDVFVEEVQDAAPAAGGGAPAGGARVGTPAAAPVGSSGYYMGIKFGVPDATAHAAAMGARANTFSDPGYVLGTIAPRAGWPA